MAFSELSRREFAQGAALLALAIGVPVATAWLSEIDPEDLPSDRQQRFLRKVAQIVIPRTDTPGAGDVGAAEFTILALAHGLDGSKEPVSASTSAWGLASFTRTNGSLKYLDWLERRLDRDSGGDWLRRSTVDQASVLAKLDGQSYTPGPPPADPSPWRKIKGLILTGYYTSEAGGSRELNYELVPGRYDPNIPLTATTRAYSSDWVAQEFG